MLVVGRTLGQTRLCSAAGKLHTCPVAVSYKPITKELLAARRWRYALLLRVSLCVSPGGGWGVESRREAFGVTWEHGGLTHVVETQVEHADSLQTCGEEKKVNSCKK